MFSESIVMGRPQFCALCGSSMEIEDASGFDRRTGRKLQIAQCPLSKGEAKTSTEIWQKNRHDRARELQGGDWSVTRDW